MKPFHAGKKAFQIIFLSLILSSCKKQLSESEGQEQIYSAPIINHGCRATVLGLYVEWHNGIRDWQTLMQRWYGPDGKLAYLKAYLGPFPDVSHNEYELDLEYGQLIYHNKKQVSLRDVLYNKTVMRVTLDDLQNPIATYSDLDSEHPEVHGGMIDTSYYYYTNKRLDSLVSIFHVTPGGNNAFRKYRFHYDSYGNLNQVDSDEEFRMHLEYDYDLPVTDMIPSHFLTSQLRLLEYMDLFRFPIHHQLKNVVIGFYFPGPQYPYQIYPIRSWQYQEYNILNNGLVYSYRDAQSNINRKTYYTGWDCGSSDITSNAKILSIKEFQSRFPESKQKGKNLR